jgi:ATP-binding cassette subfamily C exporter for protease/lipase
MQGFGPRDEVLAALRRAGEQAMERVRKAANAASVAPEAGAQP